MAIFAMYPEKSPEIDGLNPCFFQTYWNLVGMDVVQLYSCARYFLRMESYLMKLTGR